MKNPIQSLLRPLAGALLAAAALTAFAGAPQDDGIPPAYEACLMDLSVCLAANQLR